MVKSRTTFYGAGFEFRRSLAELLRAVADDVDPGDEIVCVDLATGPDRTVVVVQDARGNIIRVEEHGREAANP